MIVPYITYYYINEKIVTVLWRNMADTILIKWSITDNGTNQYHVPSDAIH